LHIEESLELCGDVFEERENPVFGMLVPESVEDEAVFGYERVSVCGNPFNFSRFSTPRKELKLKIKKAMRLKKSFSRFITAPSTYANAPNNSPRRTKLFSKRTDQHHTIIFGS
jgi:hypothetical protein